MINSALQKRQQNKKILAWENNQHLSTPPLVSREITSEERLQKFHTDDVSLPRSGLCFWLVVPRGKGASTNQNHCQTWEVTRHQHGISALVSQTSFCGETSCKVVKCRLFFFSGYNNAKSVKNRDNTIGLTIKCNMDFKQIRRQSWGNVV